MTIGLDNPVRGIVAPHFFSSLILGANMERLILVSTQSPGDVVMLTAAVRDLHRAHPGKYRTDVRTPCPALWEHNPYVQPIDDYEPGVRVLHMHYPAIHHSNQRPYHFLHGYIQHLQAELGVSIPVTEFKGDIHLSPQELAEKPAFMESLPQHYWILCAGGKFDFTTKWWWPGYYRLVANHFDGLLGMVQVGEAGHWHKPIPDAVNLVGKTSLRELVQLVYWSAGVVCPITLVMHLAAAIPMNKVSPGLRPCVVIAGGREPAHWEAYPGHRFLDTIGQLPCCAQGGCWRSRCQTVGDNDPKDEINLCVSPVSNGKDLSIPRCMDMILPRHVWEAIESYYTGGRYAPPYGIKPTLSNGASHGT